MQKFIALHTFKLALHYRSLVRPDRIVEADVVAALRWGSKHHGKNVSGLSSSFDGIRRTNAYRRWVKGRPNIKSLPAFDSYRPSPNSRSLNAEAARSIGPYSRRIEALLSEIRRHGFDLKPGQIVFSGKTFSSPPQGSMVIPTFLSTSINPSIAAGHARDHAYWKKSRGYVFVLSVAAPTKALWGQFRSFREFELLFPPGTKLDVQQVHRVRGGLYDIVEAELTAFT